MASDHQELCKFSSPRDSRFESVFWPQFEIVIDEAIASVVEPRLQESEDETAKRLRRLNVPTTDPS